MRMYAKSPTTYKRNDLVGMTSRSNSSFKIFLQVSRFYTAMEAENWHWLFNLDLKKREKLLEVKNEAKKPGTESKEDIINDENWFKRLVVKTKNRPSFHGQSCKNLLRFII